MKPNDEDLYIDLQMNNIQVEKSSQRVKCEFFQSSTQEIIPNTTNYKLSIIRFVLNTETLPVFIPTMKTNSRVDTIYSITMEYDGIYYQKYMEFHPQVLNPVEPEEYFYCLNYSYVAYLINKCLSQCLDGLINLVPTLENTSPHFTFIYDVQTKLFSIDGTFGYNDTGFINLYFNYNLNALFPSFPAMVANKNVNGMDIQFNPYLSGSTTLTQEYSTIGLLNPISSILFTSSLIPIFPSITNPAQIFSNGTQLNTSSAYSFSNIITDFVGNDLAFVPFIQYDASVYRYIALKNNNQIRNIDIQINWISKTDGRVRPIYISPGGFSSIKMLLTTEE